MAGAFEPEIAQVTSNDLEAQIRQLLPSVSGFGSRLGAQNVIVPIVDLTPIAEGSGLPEFLQRAWDESTGNATIANTTSNIITTPGFWQVDLNWSAFVGTPRTASIQTDNNSGATAKVWEITTPSLSASNVYSTAENAFIVYIPIGSKLTGTTNNAESILNVWYRQVADSNGRTVNPSGYTSL